MPRDGDRPIDPGARPRRGTPARIARVGAGLLAIACALMTACGDPRRGQGRDDEAPTAGRAFSPLLVIGRPGVGPGRFAVPRGIASDGTHLAVVDKAGRLQIFDAQRGVCVAWWTLPCGDLGKPTGLALGPAPADIDAAHRLGGAPVLWVADTHYHRVLVYAWPPAMPGFAATDPEAAARRGTPPAAAATEAAEPAEFFRAALPESAPPLLLEFGAYGTGPGQFVYPTDVALTFDHEGRLERIYVSEYGGNDRVSVFDAQRRFLFAFTGQDDGAGDQPRFDRPQGLAFDPATGELLICDARRHRVGRFTRDGRLIAWVPATLRFPWDAQPLGDGTALVVEWGRNRVQRLELTTGRTLEAWGRGGHQPGELGEPWGVATVRGRMFVTDPRNHRVQAVSLPGGLGAVLGWGGPKAEGGDR